MGGIKKTIFLSSLLFVLAVGFSIRAQDASFGCKDFQSILKFVQQEHLRFKVDPVVRRQAFFLETVRKVPALLREHGYWMMAAQFPKDDLIQNFKGTSGYLSQLESICLQLKTPTYRLGFVRSYIQNLDPFSDFYFEEEFKRKTSVVSGHFVGVGIGTQKQEDGNLLVTQIIENGPASKHLKVGDRILEVDGHPIDQLSNKEISQRIRGPIDGVVRFKASRNKDFFEVRLKRDHIFQRSVSHQWLEENLIKIKIHRFFAQTADQISSLLRQNRNRVEGIVLDLQGNPGGLLQAARDVVSLFVSSGVVVYLRGAYEDQMWSLNPKSASNVPIVVLVDEKTASASEIVAGALQDHGKAVVVGQQSFGKSCVQNIYRTEDFIDTDYSGGLKLTTLWYFLPSGRSVDSLRPDVLLADRKNTERIKMPYHWKDQIDVFPIKSSDSKVQKFRKSWSKKSLSASDENIGKKILERLIAGRES